MRGTELTPAQIKAAELFILERQCAGPVPDAETTISLPFEKMVRLVAWYGALRYRSAQRGQGSLEEPGYYAVVAK